MTGAIADTVTGVAVSKAGAMTAGSTEGSTAGIAAAPTSGLIVGTSSASGAGAETGEYWWNKLISLWSLCRQTNNSTPASLHLIDALATCFVLDPQRSALQQHQLQAALTLANASCTGVCPAPFFRVRSAEDVLGVLFLSSSSCTAW